jgi:hypothetical protein
MRIPTTKPRYLEEVKDKKYLEEQMVCILISRKNLLWILNNSWIRTLRILIFVIISTVINFILTRTPRLMTRFLLIQRLQAKCLWARVLNLQEISRICQEKTVSLNLPYKRRSSKKIKKDLRSIVNKDFRSKGINSSTNCTTVIMMYLARAPGLLRIKDHNPFFKYF